MKNILLLLAAILAFTSCGKADLNSVQKEPIPLNIEQLAEFIGKEYTSIEPLFVNSDIVISDSLGFKKATVSALDKESPSPNFVCELSEENGVITKIEIKATPESHGTYKNTFFYFDYLLSSKYKIETFYAIDADGGINTSSNGKQDLYNYLQYNTSSGAGIEFEASKTHIISFCDNESNRSFSIIIEQKK